MQFELRLRKILALVALLWLVGTLGYMLLEGWGFVDALFMTAISLTTTGYGETHPLTVPGKIFTIGLLVLGVGFFIYAISILSEAAVEGQVQGYFKKKKMEKTITKLQKHYIICGFGRIGRIIVETLLQSNVPVVVIEHDPLVIQEIEKENILHVQGDATQEEILREAGIARARGIITVLQSDADNVYTTLTARTMNPGIQVIARASDAKSERRMIQAGANRVISPYEIGARRMAFAALKPTVTEFLDLAVHSSELNLSIEQLNVQHDAFLAGKSIRDADIRQKAGVTILAVQKPMENMIASPSPDYIITEGDIIIALGDSKGLTALKALAEG